MTNQSQHYAAIQQDITIESEEEDDGIIHRSRSNLEGSELGRLRYTAALFTGETESVYG